MRRIGNGHVGLKRFLILMNQPPMQDGRKNVNL